MKRFFVPILLAFVLVACATRGVYNSLASTQQGVRLAYDGYVDSVIHGQTRTNDLPVLAKSFNAFQATWGAAVDLASGNSNAPVTADVAASASNILAAIAKAKGLK
jgi:hypothetical protein